VPIDDWQQIALEREAELAAREMEIAALQETVAALLAKVSALEERLGRNPRNSSMPPSAEGLTKPPIQSRAERRAQARRRGKQPGAEGTHLAQVASPDKRVVHRPTACTSCGADLALADVVATEIRQVFDLPKIAAFVTEHQLLKVRCSCGCETKATPPKEATAPAAYGPGLRALAVYLSVYQHVPYDRLGQIFKDVMGISVSTGAISAMVGEAGGGLGLFNDVVTDLLREAPSVHFDETGARVEGSLHWIHVASNALYTRLFCHTRRGGVAIEEFGVIGAMQGIAVHDGWRPYRNYDVAHQLCNAHHLRELHSVRCNFDQPWAHDMMDLLLDANDAVNAALARGDDHLSQAAVSELRSGYRALIGEGWAANEVPTTRLDWKGRTIERKWYRNTAINLLKRLDRYEDDVLRFASDFDAPFTNNQGERDIRMIKLQQKISGSWRSKAGADHFCALRGYVSTMKKHGHNVLEGLEALFEGEPWLPPHPILRT
jgi:transposase